MVSPVQISVKQLSRLIGTSNAPQLIDVRIDEDFADDPQYLPGALRCAHRDVASLAPSLQGSRAVVYCQKGLKLSEGAAAVLRTYDVHTEVLEGGQFAWRDAGLPLVPENRIPPRNAEGQTVWVTRLRPKIDRIACPWLIRRFVDPNAQFLFVAASAVEAVAEKFDGTPFDMEGVFWSHRGDECTFDTMLEEFGLTHEPLERLATIIRAADTNRHDLAAEAPGLLAASLGLSRMYSNDLEQLDAGMILYDAFYRWCRDAVDEGHDWPTASVKSAK